MKRILWQYQWYGVLFGLVAADVATRIACFHVCKPDGSWFGLVPFANHNFAFSLPVPPLLMYALYVLAVGFVCRTLFSQWRVLGPYQRLGLLLIACGGGVNILERLVTGYVRDFIHIWRGYYNLGDIYILAGAVLVLLWAQRTGEE